MTNPDDARAIGQALSAIVPDLPGPVDRVAAVERRVRRRRARITALAAGLVVLAVLGTSVLALAGRTAGPAATEPADPDRWVSCAAHAPTPPFSGRGTARVDDLAAVAAVLCTEESERRTDGGTYRVAVESRVDDVAQLLAALRLPDGPPAGDACPVLYVWRPLLWFALLDRNGHWAVPRLPVDGCTEVRAEVRDALETVRRTRVSATVISVIESPEAVAAGCGQFHADMISVEARGNTSVRPGAGVNPFEATAQVRRCVYRVPAAEQGTVKPAGTFEHGGTLGSDRLALIGQALAAAGPARACPTFGGRFAMLSLTGQRRQVVYVELDGCLRILIYPDEQGPGVLAQGDTALANLLDQR